MKSKIKHILEFLFLLLVSLTVTGCKEEPKVQKTENKPVKMQTSVNKLTFTAASDAKTVQPILDKIKLAYRKIGYEIEILKIPADRSLKESLENEGIDGELFRSNLIEDKLQGLIRVPVPLFNLRCIPYAKDKNINIKNLEDLKKYTFVTIAGHVAIEDKISNIEHKSVTQAEQAIKMVNEDHVQVALIIDVLAVNAIKDNNFDISAVGPPIIESQLFHYINEKHKTLLPKLTEALGEQFKVPFNEK